MLNSVEISQQYQMLFEGRTEKQMGKQYCYASLISLGSQDNKTHRQMFIVFFFS